MAKRIPQCPLCGEELEIKDMAPCDDCGWIDTEIDHFLSRKHSYSEFNVYGSTLVLCNFCDVDFSSYDPQYWGLMRGDKVGYGSNGFLKLAELPYSKLAIEKGYFCSHCKAKLKLIKALIASRLAHEQ